MTADPIQLPPGGCWILPSGSEGRDRPIDSPADLSLSARESVDGELTLFDSWEWTLWHAGQLLVGDGQSLRILDAGRPEQVVRVPIAKPPRAGVAMPDGPLRDRIAARLGLRSALPVAKLEVHQRGWDVRNQDDKTVARLIEQTWTGGLRTLSLVPLRGYDEEANIVRRALPSKAVSEDHPLRVALSSAGVQPRVWTNKPLFRFDDAPDAHHATQAMLATMLSLARETEPGVIADYDTEFLHDYRVLIRKARSLLSLTKGVFDEATTQKLKDEFRAMGRRTNALRDLDVHLMEREAQTARVPVALRAALTPLFDDLVEARVSVHKKVKTALKSATYRKSMRSLQAAIDGAQPGPKGGVSVRKLANKKIRRQLARVRTLGRAVGPATPDDEVHALRLECKKLRYLLEFFRALYPSDRVASTTKALKRLQDVLGTFNDRSVQQAALYTWLEEGRAIATPTAAAVGALIGALAVEQRHMRDTVETAFAAFDRAEVGWR